MLLDIKTLVLLFCFFVANYTFGQTYKKKKTTFFTLCGKVTELRGNYMPDPDAPQKAQQTTGTGVQREVYFFAPASSGEGQTESGCFKKVNAIFIKKVKTDVQGNYCIRLPKGSYSVFTKEAEGFFANKSDADGILNPVQINTNMPANYNLVISNKATF
jgi:hypothetical protein